MKIRTRMCCSLDGFVSTADGKPAQLSFPDWDPVSFGFPEFQAECDAVLMGRTTFEPALSAGAWPWGDTPVFVLGSERPDGVPEAVVFDDDPSSLYAKLREANHGGDVHLVGGPQTVEAFRSLGVLDELGLIILPLFLGEGMTLSSSVASDIGHLSLRSTRSLPSGAVQVLYGLD